ncbi:hypothetical protein DPX16_7072 [Anabarilius grahami]|uniref:Uncharacterized protein n=1 Tax=Anabarilius grahami TaxID=495550 RepID=A0A3N0Y1M7_ANAGA|nr:hypothetical protein DPX16_7072 [Anabarilius grahami]
MAASQRQWSEEKESELISFYDGCPLTATLPSKMCAASAVSRHRQTAGLIAGCLGRRGDCATLSGHCLREQPISGVITAWV